MTRKYVVTKYKKTFTEVLAFLDEVERDIIGIYEDYEIEIFYDTNKDVYKVRITI